MKQQNKPRRQIVSVNHASNVLGTVTDVKSVSLKWISRRRHPCCGWSQAARIKGVDVQALNCDFYAFSGHKMLQQALASYMEEALLQEMNPVNSVEKLILCTTREYMEWIIWKFEAGTQISQGHWTGCRHWLFRRSWRMEVFISMNKK